MCACGHFAHRPRPTPSRKPPTAFLPRAVRQPAAAAAPRRTPQTTTTSSTTAGTSERKSAAAPAPTAAGAPKSNAHFRALLAQGKTHRP
jgi:hypothetical protein